MKVADIIALLQNLPPDAEVYLCHPDSGSEYGIGYVGMNVISPYDKEHNAEWWGATWGDTVVIATE